MGVRMLYVFCLCLCVCLSVSTFAPESLSLSLSLLLSLSACMCVCARACRRTSGNSRARASAHTHTLTHYMCVCIGVQAAMNAAMHQMLANGALPAGANINMNLSLNSTQGQAPLSQTPNAAPQSGAFLESSMPATSTGGDGGSGGGGGGDVGSIADTAQLPQQQRALYDLLRTGDSQLCDGGPRLFVLCERAYVPRMPAVCVCLSVCDLVCMCAYLCACIQQQCTLYAEIGEPCWH